MHGTGSSSEREVPSRMRLGLVLERRESLHPWGTAHWRPIAVLPGGGPDAAAPRPATGTDETTRTVGQHTYAGALDVELFRSDTEGYRENLETGAPQIYVVMRARGDDDGIVPFLMTVCPFEAQDYTDSGEETVESIGMPPEVVAWVQAFVDRHHSDTPFVKRKRKAKRERGEADPFWREPPVTRRDR